MIFSRAIHQTSLVFILWAFQLTSPLVDPAIAATFAVVNTETKNTLTNLGFEPVCNAEMIGLIGEGDVEKARDKLASARFLKDDADLEGGRGIPALCLDSAGGDLNVALKLAEIFRGWMMVVPNDWACESACAMLFMSARAGMPGRYLHINGTLGFHRPDLKYPERPGQGVGTDEVEKAYRDALATLRQVIYPRRLGNSAHSFDDIWRRMQQIETSLSTNQFNIGDVHSRDAPNFAVGRSDENSLLPLDLLFMFLSSDKMYYIRTIKQAMHWEIDVYGRSMPYISKYNLATACINVAAVACYNDKPCWIPRHAFPAKTIDRARDYIFGEIIEIIKQSPNANDTKIASEIVGLEDGTSDDAKEMKESIRGAIEKHHELNVATSDLPLVEFKEYLDSMWSHDPSGQSHNRTGNQFEFDTKWIWRGDGGQPNVGARRVQVFEYYLKDRSSREPRSNLPDVKCEIKGVIVGKTLTRLHIKTFNERAERILRPWMSLPFSVTFSELYLAERIKEGEIDPSADPNAAAGSQARLLRSWFPVRMLID